MRKFIVFLCAALLFLGIPNVFSEDLSPPQQDVASIYSGHLDLYLQLGVFFFLLFMVFFGITVFLVRHTNYDRLVANFNSKKLRIISCVALSGFVVAVGLVTMYALHSVKTRSIDRINIYQKASLKLTSDALELWVAEKVSFVKQFGANPYLYQLTRRLLALGGSADNLSTSGELWDAQLFFIEASRSLNITSGIDFNILNQDSTIIASWRKKIVGTQHIVAKNHSDLMSLVFAGATVFVPPLLIEGSTDPLNMFVMGPIKRSDGTVVAAFVLCLDPTAGFSSVIGESTDNTFSGAFAFNKKAQLLSAIKSTTSFAASAVSPDKKSSLDVIELRVPPVKKLGDTASPLVVTKRPLTSMVERALALKAKIESLGQEADPVVIERDSKGYLDHRGVTVIGAWLWNFNLDVGLATEVDLEEALVSYYYLRNLLLTILTVTLVLSLGATFFVLGLGARNNRILSLVKEELEGKIARRTAALERHQAQLKASEERLRLILSSMGEGLFQIDNEGVCVYINDAGEYMLGYERYEILGQPIHDLIRDKSAADGDDQISPIHRALGEGFQCNSPDDTFWRKDGSSFPVEFSATPIEQNGQVTGVVVVFLDITERKRTEHALKESEERYAIVLRGANDGLWDWNVGAETIYCSPRLKEIAGCGENTAVTLDLWHSWVHPDDLEELVGESGLCLTGEKEKYAVEYRIKDGHGGWQWVLERGTSVKDSHGQVVRLAGTFSDVTDRKLAEQKTRESEELLRFSLVAVGAYYWQGSTATHDKVYDSPQLFLSMGYDLDEIPSTIEGIIALTHPDDQEYARNAYFQHINNNAEMFRIESRYRRKDGSYCWVLNVGRVLGNDDPTQPGKLVGITLVIDEQKKNQQLLEALFDSIPVPLTVIDANSRKILRVNKACLEFNELSEADILLCDPDEMLVNGEADKNRLQKAISDGKQIEIEMKRLGTGDKRWVLFKGSVVEYAGRAAFLGSYSDIGASKHSQRRLIEKQQFLQAVIDNSGALICVKDFAGRYILVNDAWKDSLGVEKMDLLGKRDADIFNEEVVEVVASLDSEAIARMKPVLSEDKITIHDRTRYFKSVRFPLFDADGKIYSVCGILTDITAYKNIEGDLQTRVQQLDHAQKSMIQVMSDLEDEKLKAEAATRAKSDFLANMSHEIRTPMNAVMGMTHLALQTELTGKQKNYLDKIDKSAQALLGIINDILDFSKIEAGKMTIEETHFSLSDVIVNLSNSLNVQLKLKGLEFIVRIAPDVPINLIGDSLRIGQILLNLGHNATKFTDHGEVEIGVECLQAYEGKVLLKFTVRDTGIGLTEEHRSKLFQSFSQADTSTTRKYGGTGLGLTICKQLSGLMGGDIGVDSVPGEGSTFWFTILLGAEKGSAITERKHFGDFKKLRVLIAAPNKTLRDVLVESFDHMGCRSMAVSVGTEVLAAVEHAAIGEQFELILLDWTQGQGDGLATLRGVRHAVVYTPPPPVIMLTSGISESQMSQAFKLGGVSFIEKPIQGSILFDTLIGVFSRDGKGRMSTIPFHTSQSHGVQMFNNENVLLAEDNEINQEVALEILRGFGLNVVIAPNGREAVNLFSAQKFDIVLMDIQMPEMDGLEATAKIRALDEGRDVPIVAMTAHAMVGDREKSLAAGMNDHVTKPIDPATLNMTLAKWLGNTKQKPIVAETETKPSLLFSKKYLGLDVSEGLTRVAGNEKLYKKLLGKFVADHIATVAEIKELITLGDKEGAVRLAHTMKSVGGNIGAKHVYQKALEVEQCLLSGDDVQSLESLEEFNVAIEIVAKSIDTILATTENEEVEDVAGEDLCSPEQLKKMLAEIYFLLADDFSAAMDHTDELVAKMKGLGVDTEIAALAEAIDSFDSDGALELIKKISQVLNVELEG